MFQLCEILAFSFFALTATLALQIQASPDTISDVVLSHVYYPSSPSPSPYAFDEESQNANYVENPSLPPNSPAPPSVEAEEDEDDNEDKAFYYSRSKAPTPTPSPTEFNSGLSYDDPADMAPQVAAPPPVLPFTYSAEDDSGEFSTESEGDDVYQEQRKSSAVIGFVMGAVCLVGLGGLVYKNRKNQIQKRHKQTAYLQLSKRDEEA